MISSLGVLQLDTCTKGAPFVELQLLKVKSEKLVGDLQNCIQDKSFSIVLNDINLFNREN